MWRKLYSLLVVMTAMAGLAMLPACEEEGELDVDTPAVDRDLDLDNDVEINRVEPVPPPSQTTPESSPGAESGDRTNVIIEPNQAPIPPQPDDQQQQPGATTPPASSTQPAQPGATTPQP